jgi:hypothetical protein
MVCVAVEALQLRESQLQADLLVLAVGGGALAAVDLGNGGLVRAPYVDDGRIAPYDIVTTFVTDPPDRDPSQPEAIDLRGPTEITGRLRGRKAERFVRPLVHPPDAPLLGITGLAVPYWTLCGDRPSIAVVEPNGTIQIVRHGRRVHCYFEWRGATIDLPVVDRRVAVSMMRRGQGAFTIRRRFVVALTPPRLGNCYKVVAGLLPRA